MKYKKIVIIGGGVLGTQIAFNVPIMNTIQQY